jgi:lysophospholipase L1-like esterase
MEAAPDGHVPAQADPTPPGSTLATTSPEPPARAATPAPPAEPSPARSPTARRRHVVAIGDSLTDPRAQGGKYLDFVASRCPASVLDNHGKGGDMVNMMRRRFERDVLPRAEQAADVTDLLVFGGVNDLYSDLTAHRTQEKIRADLSAMYAAGRARGWRVIALTVAPWAGLRRYYNPSREAATLELNEWIRARAAAGDVDVVVDAYALLSCGTPELLCPDYALADGVHMNTAGHEVLGEALFRAAFSDCQ